jgi:hypothetical protein
LAAGGGGRIVLYGISIAYEVATRTEFQTQMSKSLSQNIQRRRINIKHIKGVTAEVKKTFLII